MSGAFIYGGYVPADREEEDFLRSYDPDKWKKASHTADIAVFAVSEQGLELLLIRRGGYPYKGRFCLPGGFINMDESLEEAAARELEEETGLSNLPLYQVFTYGDVGREPRDRRITTLFLTFLNKDVLDAEAGDDAEEAEWFLITDHDTEAVEAGNTRETYISMRLEGKESFEPRIKITDTYNPYRKTDISIPEAGGLAFDHARLVIDAYEYLCQAFLTTDIARNILGAEFSPSELKKLFSAVFLRDMADADMPLMPICKNEDGSCSFV